LEAHTKKRTDLETVYMLKTLYRNAIFIS